MANKNTCDHLMLLTERLVDTLHQELIIRAPGDRFEIIRNYMRHVFSTFAKMGESGESDYQEFIRALDNKGGDRHTLKYDIDHMNEYQQKEYQEYQENLSDTPSQKEKPEDYSHTADDTQRKRMIQFFTKVFEDLIVVMNPRSFNPAQEKLYNGIIHLSFVKVTYPSSSGNLHVYFGQASGQKCEIEYYISEAKISFHNPYDH